MGRHFPLVYVTVGKERRGMGPRRTMKRRVVTNWRKRNVSLEKAILATGKETKEREREKYGWRNMRGCTWIWEINSRGLRGIGRAEFILRIRGVSLSRCNCNDDLYRAKRIDSLPTIPRNWSLLYCNFIYSLFTDARITFRCTSSRRFFRRSRIL